jgi:DNA-directed RNA polymerase subunit RPC12/RpoP
MLGIGMMYSSLEAVLDLVVPRKRREKIREILRTADPGSTEYSHRLYACPQCNALHQRFHIKICKENRAVYEPRFRCGTCWSSLVPAGDDVSQYCCRFCGSKALEQSGWLMWD